MIKQLSVFTDSEREFFNIRPCVQCGLCCTKGVCAFGVWNEEKKQCSYLEELPDGRYNCSEYERIRVQPGADANPAFGFGCCMPLFNTRRDAILKRQEKTSVSKEQ